MISLIAGPTNFSKVLRFGKIKLEQYSNHLDQIAKTMINYIGGINIIPDKGIPLDFAKHFGNLGGKVFGYVPQGGFPQFEENFKYCSEVIEFDSGWSGLNTCLSLKGDLVTVLGMSPGTMVEIAYTKYHNRYLGKNIPLLIDRQSISKELPDEISEELDVHYFSNKEELGRLLRMIKGVSK